MREWSKRNWVNLNWEFKNSWGKRTQNLNGGRKTRTRMRNLETRKGNAVNVRNVRKGLKPQRKRTHGERTWNGKEQAERARQTLNDRTRTRKAAVRVQRANITKLVNGTRAKIRRRKTIADDSLRKWKMKIERNRTWEVVTGKIARRIEASWTAKRRYNLKNALKRNARRRKSLAGNQALLGYAEIQCKSDSGRRIPIWTSQLQQSG